MAKWIDAKIAVPNHSEMVEIAAWCKDNEPPFWYLSHAWYCSSETLGYHFNGTPKWVRKGGENWEVEFWRESEMALVNEKPWEE